MGGFMKLPIFITIVAVFIGGSVYAKTDQQRWCGTKPGTFQTEYLIKQHERHERQLKSVAAQRIVKQSLNTDIGEVAVIEGSSSTIIDPNPFDLEGKKLSFNEASGKYTFRRKNGSVSSAQGNPITLGDDDSEKIDFTGGFTFPFFGKTYNSVFVNSDGNLTFQDKDDAGSPRDVFRVLTGPPRLAVFFNDLNPSVGGQVLVLQTATSFRVTWKNVPEFDSSNSNTFQVTLSRSGNIRFAYSKSIDAKDAVVGISPGDTGASTAKFVDLSKLRTTKGIDDAVVERFSSEPDLDFIALLQEFHSTRRKIFDLITIFTDKAYLIIIDPGAFAFFSHVQNHDEGIGLGDFDFSKTTSTSIQMTRT
jgi:hypothetical protein